MSGGSNSGWNWDSKGETLQLVSGTKATGKTTIPRETEQKRGGGGVPNQDLTMLVRPPDTYALGLRLEAAEPPWPPSPGRPAPCAPALTFFLSLLNFFCSASSSSLSPGGITNMLAPGSRAEPKTSFSTVTTQNPHVVRRLSVLYLPQPPGPPTPASGLALTPGLHEAAVRPPAHPISRRSRLCPGSGPLGRPGPGGGEALPATPRPRLPTPMPSGVRSANLGVRWAEEAAGPAQRSLGSQRRRRRKNPGPPKGRREGCETEPSPEGAAPGPAVSGAAAAAARAAARGLAAMT